MKELERCVAGCRWPVPSCPVPGELGSTGIRTAGKGASSPNIRDVNGGATMPPQRMSERRAEREVIVLAMMRMTGLTMLGVLALTTVAVAAPAPNAPGASIPRPEGRAVMAGRVPQTVRTWTMAFVLTTRPGTDTSTAAFQAKIGKVTDVRDRMDKAMRIATEGLGAITPSDEVFLVQIDPPPNGVVNDGDTNGFARDVAKLLYEQTTDVWDFIAVYADYATPMVGSRYVRAKNNTTKIGFQLWDGTEHFGSAGRLMGVGLIDDVARMPQQSDYADGDVQLLLHETIGHQYGVFHPEINRLGAHFALGLQSPCFTMMYGRPWKRVDDTHFKCEQGPNPNTGVLGVKFHPWMMYMMGLKERSKVPAQLMRIALDELPDNRYSQYETTGTFEWVTMTDLFGPPTGAEIPRPPLSLANSHGIIVAPVPGDPTERVRRVDVRDRLRIDRRVPRVGPMAPE